ncbi:MAG: AAA family ATPase [Chloroflexi bacterium]|nr:AAA family ATPase [Chloroflexota bacterium]
MIGVLEIKNFKSIKHLTLNCKRINVFIGQPNTGKSNILESLGLLSFGCYSRFTKYTAKQFIRHESPSNLFFEGNLELPISIKCDNDALILLFKDGRFEGSYEGHDSRRVAFQGDFDKLEVTGASGQPLTSYKYYRFIILDKYIRQESDFLLPPFGENLLTLLLSNRELRSLANQPFTSIGLRLGLRPQEGKIEIVKDYEDIIVSFPYHLTSDTLQRLIFYMAAILTNKQSVLVFEEPESHAFPYYTKYLAEMIALDENENQYFMSTHNPYFLLPLLEKTDKDDIAIFITYYEDYQTKVKPMDEADIQRITEIDVFSNIESFLEP